MTRLRRQRRRSERLHPRSVFARAGVLMVLVGGFLYVALNAAHGLPWSQPYRIEAQFADAKGIVKNSEVWIAGHRVGQVTGSRVEGSTSFLALQLENEIEPLPADTKARLRFTSLLGALVIELTPGTSAATIPQGGGIPATQTSSASQLADVLSALDAKRRPRLRTTLTELGRGLAGRGQQVNAALAAGADFASDLRSTSAAVNARTGAAPRLFPALRSLSAAADPVRADIARGLRPQANVLGVMADARGDLTDLLETAPSALESTQRGLGDVTPLLVAARRLARSAHAVGDPAPRAFRSTAALLKAAQGTLPQTRDVLLAASRTTPRVLGLARLTGRLTPRLGDGVTDPLPALAKLDAHTCDFLRWARNWRSMLGLSGVGAPAPTSIGPLTFLRVEVASAFTSQSFLGREPLDRHRTSAYPAPCTSTDEKLP